MFDVIANKDISINTIEFNFNGCVESAHTYAVYKRNVFATHVGSEEVITNWDLVNTATVSCLGLNPSSVTENLNIVIPAGETLGLYLEAGTRGVLATTSVTVAGTPYVNNSDLTITNGYGMSDFFEAFSLRYVPNIRVNYEIIGCTDPSACNYDIDAAEDNGTCTYPDGCTDSDACNYDFSATCDDGSCTYEGCTNPGACNFDTAAGCDDGSCIDPTSSSLLSTWSHNNTQSNQQGGQMFDVVAINDINVTSFDFMFIGCGSSTHTVQVYKRSSFGSHAPVTLNPAAWELISENVVSCSEFDSISNTGRFNAFVPAGQSQAFYIQCVDNSIYGNWVGGMGNLLSADTNLELYVGSPLPPGNAFGSGYGSGTFGCQFTGQVNYSVAIQGCTDPGACNYDASATCDDGSCMLLYGCTSAEACNYDPLALCDDGSCNLLPVPEIQSVPGSPIACEGGAPITISGVDFCPNSTVTIDGIPVFIISIDQTEVVFLMPSGSGEVTLEISGNNGSDTALLNYAAPQLFSSSLTTTCYGSEILTITGINLCDVINVSFGVSLAPVISFDASSITCIVPAPLIEGSAPILVETGSGFSNSLPFTNGIFGCTSGTACNYNPAATCEDGSCVFPGCQYSAACNYNPLASCDDGSCEFTSCAGCTEATACNYNASATINDGSCEYTSCVVAGCTYPDSPEYNSSATVDDGTCTFEAEPDDCPSDLNNDGSINTGDLNALLSVYGSNCP